MDSNKYSKLRENLETLAKADMSLSEALALARKHNPEAGKILAGHIYKDRLVPKVGNRFAYEDFLKRHGNSGVHLSMDANSFGAINKEHGFETGDEAIKQLFNTASDVSRKYGLKLFRVGGDEGRLHASSPERANAFLKEFKDKLAKNPKIAGQHQISASIGVGYNPEHAERALIQAKDKLGPLVNGKRNKINKPGEEETVFHSLLHESPPANWHPSVGKVPPMPHEENTSTTPSALKLNNPLKVA